jgi:hypothetical protein
VAEGRDLVEGSGELRRGFDQRRALQRALSRLAPQVRGLLDQPSLGAVSRQQFRLVLGDFGKLTFKSFGNTSVQRTT